MTEEIKKIIDLFASNEPANVEIAELIAKSGDGEIWRYLVNRHRCNMQALHCDFPRPLCLSYNQRTSEYEYHFGEYFSKKRLSQIRHYEYIDMDALLDLPKLEYLSLFKNTSVYLPLDIGYRIPNLEHLGLSKIGIHEIPESLKFAPRLKLLDLTDNPIKKAPIHIPKDCTVLLNAFHAKKFSGELDKAQVNYRAFLKQPKK